MKCPESQQVECVREIVGIAGELKVTNSRLNNYNTLLEDHILRTNILQEEVKQVRNFQYMLLVAVTLISAIIPLLVKVYF